MRLIGSAMFGAAFNMFNLVTSVGVPTFLEHWKMIVFKLIVALSNNFSYRKRLPKWRKLFVKNGYIKPGFLSKSSKFRVVWTIRFSSNFFIIWYKHFVRNRWRDFRLPAPVLATVARKSVNGKFTVKIDFPIDRAFYVIIAVADIQSLKSLHTLFDKYLAHRLVKYERNRMVWTIHNFVLFDKKLVNTEFLTKYWRHFGGRFWDWNNCLMLKY